MGSYGRWSLVEPMFAVLGNLALAGSNYGLIRFISKEGHQPAPVFRHLRGRVVPFATAAGIAGALIPWALGFGFGASFAFSLALVLDANVLLGLAAMRAAAMPWRYAVIVSARVLGYLSGLMVLLFASDDPEASSMIYCWLVGSTSGALSTELVVARLPGADVLGVRGVSLRAGASYGVPILMASFMIAPLGYLDRLVLAQVRGAEIVGEYAVHVRIASILTPALTAPLALWWPAARFRHARDGDGGTAFFRRTQRIAVVAYLLVGAIIWGAGSIVLQVFAPEARFHGWTLSLLLGALAMQGLANHVFNVGLLDVGHTRGTVFAASIALLVLGVSVGPLTSALGGLGAAAATCAGAFAYLGGVHGLSQRARRRGLRSHLRPSTVGLTFLMLCGGAL